MTGLKMSQGFTMEGLDSMMVATLQRPTVSVVIPTKDEQDSIAAVIRGFKDALEGISHEIVVVDRSSDNTPVEAVRAGAKLVRQIGHGGVGDALVQGFYWAKGEYIVFVDGDSTYDPQDIHNILRPLMRGEADLVNGNRFTKMESGAMPLLNRIGNHILTSVLNLFFHTKIKDSQSGFKGFRREILSSLPLFERGFSVCSEMIAEAARLNLRIGEVGISYRRRVGKTKLNPATAGPSILWASLKMVSDYRPLFLFTAIGVVFLVAGFVVAWPIITTYVAEGTFALMGRALMAVFCWLAGLTSIFTGIILNAVTYSVRKIEGRLAKQQ